MHASILLSLNVSSATDASLIAQLFHFRDNTFVVSFMPAPVHTTSSSNVTLELIQVFRPEERLQKQPNAETAALGVMAKRGPAI